MTSFERRRKREKEREREKKRSPKEVLLAKSHEALKMLPKLCRRVSSRNRISREVRAAAAVSFFWKGNDREDINST